MAMVQTTVNTAVFTLGKAEIAMLKTVAEIASKRFSHLILSNVVLSSINGILTAEATDLEMYAHVEIMDAGEMDGIVRVAIPAKQVKTWKPGATLTLIADGFGKYTINGFTGNGEDVESMPKHPELSAACQQVAVSARYFADFLACASHASDSETRPVLQMVCHRRNTLVSTDSMRLMQIQQPIDWAHDVLIPWYHGKPLAKLFGKTGALMIYDAHHTRYDGSGVRVYVRNAEGAYPQTDRIWPTSFNHEGTVSNVKAWLEALETAAKIVQDKKQRTRPLMLEVFTDHAEISTQDSQGQKYHVSLPYTGNGSISLYCNPSYLLDALQELGDSVVMRIANNKTPFTLSDCANRSALISPVYQNNA